MFQAVHYMYMHIRPYCKLATDLAFWWSSQSSSGSKFAVKYLAVFFIHTECFFFFFFLGMALTGPSWWNEHETLLLAQHKCIHQILKRDVVCLQEQPVFQLLTPCSAAAVFSWNLTAPSSFVLRPHGIRQIWRHILAKAFELIVLRNCAQPVAQQLCHKALSNYFSLRMKQQYNPWAHYSTASLASAFSPGFSLSSKELVLMIFKGFVILMNTFSQEQHWKIYIFLQWPSIGMSDWRWLHARLLLPEWRIWI